MLTVRAARASDGETIRTLLAANASDRSLFQQSSRQIERTVDDFLLAVDPDDAGRDAVVGCAALHWHSATNAEILAVAVTPAGHGRGTGTVLVESCVSAALARGARTLWLATAKPTYFARFRFVAFSRFRLPVRVLLTKLRLVFQQPVRRWLPALFGRHTFMRLASGDR